MVARGDLGVEIPMEQVPIVQKSLVKKANEAAKVSTIATQMLRSMVDAPIPTRAEVSDITNAVLDGCDAILLSDETAVGNFPVETVKVAETTIRAAETMYPIPQGPHFQRPYPSHSSRCGILGTVLEVQAYCHNQHRTGRPGNFQVPTGKPGHRFFPR